MADNENNNAASGGVPPMDSAKKKELAQKGAKDKRKLIVIIACVAVIGLALLIIIIGAVSGKSGTGGGTVPEPSYFEDTAPAADTAVQVSETTTLLQTEAQLLTTTQPAATAAPTEVQTTAQPATTAPAASAEENQTAAQQTTEPFTIEGLEPLTKTGDNMLSDSKNNEFIKIVSEKYGIEPEKLVAIYAVPDKGNNFVLEFSGETDSEGNIIKSPDTLYRIHLVDLKRDVKTATGKITGNKGVSYAEGLLTMQMIKGIVMPQHADYFTGVEQPD